MNDTFLSDFYRLKKQAGRYYIVMNKKNTSILNSNSRAVNPDRYYIVINKKDIPFQILTLVQ